MAKQQETRTRCINTQRRASPRNGRGGLVRLGFVGNDVCSALVLPLRGNAFTLEGKGRVDEAPILHGLSNMAEPPTFFFDIFPRGPLQQHCVSLAFMQCLAEYNSREVMERTGILGYFLQ